MKKQSKQKEDKHAVEPLVREFYPEYYSLHEYPADKCAVFSSPTAEWGIFSNFGKRPITVNGLEFRNSEHLFQLMKYTDVEPLMDIYKASGRAIKMKNKHWEKVDKRRPDWGPMLIDAMKFCLQMKYEQCEAFRDGLEKSAGLYIVERCPKKSLPIGDTWSTALNDDFYKGSNLMGRLLMELRDNGKLEYKLPGDALDFIDTIKQLQNK